MIFSFVDPLIIFIVNIPLPYSSQDCIWLPNLSYRLISSSFLDLSWFLISSSFLDFSRFLGSPSSVLFHITSPYYYSYYLQELHSVLTSRFTRHITRERRTRINSLPCRWGSLLYCNAPTLRTYFTPPNSSLLVDLGLRHILRWHAIYWSKSFPYFNLLLSYLYLA